MKTYSNNDIKKIIDDLRDDLRNELREELRSEQNSKFRRFVVFAVVLCLILSSITGVASYTFGANQVSYTAKDTTWEVENTKDAIDELRDNIGASLVGSIFSYMGTTAPYGYLACDGSEYNISDYPRLANHINKHFGSYNYFGGDGTTTFRVPDLRGEFLRGTGTATRNSGSGSSVGKHQDATYHYNIYNGSTTDPGLYYYIGSKSPNSNAPLQSDKIISASEAMGNTIRYGQNSNSSYNVNQPSLYTSRPTNTSVLYIIKY